MATTVSLEGIVLPSPIIWTDRNSWSGIQQTSERVLGGRQVTEYASLVGGRPVTLQSERNQGWVTWGVFKQLEALARTPGAVCSLQIGTFFAQVIFRHEDTPALDWEPIIKRLSPSDADVGLITLKLKTI